MSLSGSLMASLHYLTLALGCIAVIARGRAIKTLDVPKPNADALKRLFAYDALWGIAAVLWILSGFARIPLEKTWDYYIHMHWFWAKMGLVGAIFALELLPMLTFIGWRRKRSRGEPIQLAPAQKKRLFILNHIELGLIPFIVILAGFMARAITFREP